MFPRPQPDLMVPSSGWPVPSTLTFEITDDEDLEAPNLPSQSGTQGTGTQGPQALCCKIRGRGMPMRASSHPGLAGRGAWEARTRPSEGRFARPLVPAGGGGSAANRAEPPALHGPFIPQAPPTNPAPFRAVLSIGEGGRERQRPWPHGWFPQSVWRRSTASPGTARQVSGPRLVVHLSRAWGRRGGVYVQCAAGTLRRTSLIPERWNSSSRQLFVRIQEPVRWGGAAGSL